MMVNTTVGQFFLVLMTFSAQFVICSTSYGNVTDRLSLLEFKNAISLDPQQVLMSWNDSTHFCKWEGVMCNLKTPPRIISLNLTNLGLVGQISPSLGNLTFLKHLLLPKNAFTGHIPPSLGDLHRLEILQLSNNTLQGTIPNLSNCSNLKTLQLRGNNLVGQFPDLPHRLQYLVLSHNSLTGLIPSSLANITTLKAIDCTYNVIEGNIPNELGKLTNLEFFSVGVNKLVGRFPHAILNLSALTGLDLAMNELSGDVPSNLGTCLPNLRSLGLVGNFFTGDIPSSLMNASNLQLIDMSSNNFTGVVPSSISQLSKLMVLSLGVNQLQARNEKDWEFMYSLTNCTELRVLSIAVNRFEGHPPNSLGNLSLKLQSLYLGENQLSGSFPSGIANLHNLILLALENNQFTGKIPDWLKTLNNLQAIYLGRNKFTGFVPSSLSNLSKLAYLFLDSNHFEGHLPESLGELQVLDTLSISNNLLHGMIPSKIFDIPAIRAIDLSVNNLHGQLPTEVGNAKGLIRLQLSSNKLTGDIPNTLGNCESMGHLMLDWNSFSGSIPISLGNIRNLQVLNLSHNNLTGSIPASLGNLQLLQQLDLTFNHLKGVVPTKGIFSNVTAMRINGNPGLCGGALDLHLVACPVTPVNSSKHKRSTIQKVVIPLSIIVLLSIVISVMLLWRGKQKRSLSLPSFNSNFPKVSYNDLARATEGFSASNLIGKGRYSSVYKGKLFQDRFEVAVKVFSLETKGAQKSFIAECNALRNMRHRNLVPILTACSSIDSKGNNFRALVFKFMPQGDLHALLYSTQGDGNTSTLIRITVAQRLSIAVDVADALEYLHHNNHGTIVHCDLKPSNILLDDNMTAHVGDFGLARFKVDSASPSFGDSISTSSIAIKGTIGYVAPEFAAGGEVSVAGDVYSFGIVLLEIFLRKRPTDDMFMDGLNIVTFVERNFPDRISQIMDPELLEEQHGFSVATKEINMERFLSVLNIGLCCTKASPNERMNMQEVAARLRGIKEAYHRGH